MVKTIYRNLSRQATLAHTAFFEFYPRIGRRLSYRLYRKALVHLAEVNPCTLVPIPELGISAGRSMAAGKGQTSPRRWQLIHQTLPRGASLALDIGCHNGFFPLRLAAAGLFAIGVDPDEDLLRLAQLAALETKIDRVAFCQMFVTPDNISILPEVDVTLVMSVMHRWVRAYGREAAERMLQILWHKTRGCLYFEIPNPCQNSKEAALLSYMGDSEERCEQFMTELLSGLGAREVQLLGYFPTDFRPNERRHLFVAKR